MFLKKNYPSHSSLCTLEVFFRIKNRLSSKFTFKDKISKEMRSLLCYKFQCSSCNATYYGKTKRLFKVRVSKHMGVSARTGKNITSTKNSNGTNDFWIKLQESLLIHRDGPQLNKTSESPPLMLFS